MDEDTGDSSRGQLIDFSFEWVLTINGDSFKII